MPLGPKPPCSHGALTAIAAPNRGFKACASKVSRREKRLGVRGWMLDEDGERD